MTIKVIVTDIEGTTSAIDFVHEVLFPYASKHLPDFVRKCQSDPDLEPILDSVRNEAGEADADTERVIEILLQWIDADRKVTALKALQGLVWKHGYENGDFTGHMYEDAVTNLRSWAAAGIALYVYSSGSVGAQKLLFGYSDAGDLTPLFRGYYDTNINFTRGSRNLRLLDRSLVEEDLVPNPVLPDARALLVHDHPHPNRKPPQLEQLLEDLNEVARALEGEPG